MPMYMPSRMARIRQRIARLLPASLVRDHSRRREMRALSRIQAVDCDVRNLRPARSIDLKEVLTSDEIGMRWDRSSKHTDLLRIPERRGGLNLGDRRAVYDLVSRLNPASVLEIGTHIGASTLHIASALFTNPVRDGTPPAHG